MTIQNNLLIRIDERQKEMAKDVASIKNKLNCTVVENDDYKDMKEKVYRLWDERNKMVGWMLGAGIAGGGISALLSSAVKTVFALIK
jgi:hypothetical protein